MATLSLSLPVASTAGQPAAPLDFSPLQAGRRFRVLFVYPNVRMRMPHLGLAMLSACAKRIGAESEICDLTGVPNTLAAEVARCRIQRDPPDLVALTATMAEWPQIARVVQVCKELGLRHVVGGAHATSDPDGVIGVADALVLGEGEGAFMDIVRALAGGGPLRELAGLANTWVRLPDGRVAKTPRRDLIADLDVLPLPDWSLFHRLHYEMAHRSWTQPRGVVAPAALRATFEGSRGCPYRCTYCCNTGYMDDYRGKGRWRREKSVERMIRELKAFRETMGSMDRVVWVDEIFMTGRPRLVEFCERYRDEIGVPFNIQERPENITAEKIERMAAAGLDEVAIGFESGDEHIRRAVLNRKTKAGVLEAAFALPHEHGVRTLAYTMVGLPGQDEASMVETWRMLRAIRTDACRVSIFFPMKGTPLYDECVRRGLHDPANDLADLDGGPVIKHDCLDDDTIVRYQKLLNLFATQRGPWPGWVFALSRRNPRLAEVAVAMRQRWKHNQEAGLRPAANAWDVVRRHMRRKGRRPGRLHAVDVEWTHYGQPLAPASHSEAAC